MRGVHPFVPRMLACMNNISEMSLIAYIACCWLFPLRQNGGNRLQAIKLAAHDFVTHFGFLRDCALRPVDI